MAAEANGGLTSAHGNRPLSEYVVYLSFYANLTKLYGISFIIFSLNSSEYIVVSRVVYIHIYIY